jgi:diguanylate cyclase (GGDEF)-like protein
MRANRRPDPPSAALRMTPEIACLQSETAHGVHALDFELPRFPARTPEVAITHPYPLAAAGEAALGLDKQGRVTFVNAMAETLTGWKAAEFIGRTVHDMVHPSLQPLQPLQNAVRSGNDTRESGAAVPPRQSCAACLALPIGEARRCENQTFWKKDGTSFTADCTSTLSLLDGQVLGSVLLFRDVTSQKRQEAWEKDKGSILAVITAHEDLAETLHLIASAFTRVAPGWSIALLTSPERGGARRPAHQFAQSLELAASCGALRFRRPIPTEAFTEAVETKHPPSHAPWPEPSLCRRAVEAGQRLFATRAVNEPALREPVWSELAHPGCAACLAVPLLSHEGVTLGVAAFLAESLPQEEGMDPVLDEICNGVCNLARLAIEYQQLHQEVLRQSHHDHLTGLPNRLLLEDRLERAILHARRYGTQLAVACIDLDHFKQINDMLGHGTGDAVLREVSRLMRESLRDIDTVARQGGDEFLVILPDLKSELEADTICDRILAVLRQPLVIDGQTVTLTASLGRTVYPLHLENASELLKHADIALHTAKCAGRDRMVAFSYDLGERHRRDIELQRELRHALEHKQFHLHYQPLYSSARDLKGFEALLRWTHPRLGEISPGEFIPLAEKSGLIIPIGGWVLHEACRQAQEWSRLSVSPVKMFVNVSGVQLGQPNFAETISAALASTGLACDLLNLEITETCIVADTKTASSKLRQLRELGIRISIDDFGCGHSTFSYLQQLPIDTLKIDRSFITCLDGTEKNSAIVRAIVALAEELGLETIAEGVETGLQFNALQSTHCDLFQGFLLARPLSAYAARLVVLEQAAGQPSNLPTPSQPTAPQLVSAQTLKS